jgi:hypothetical protein
VIEVYTVPVPEPLSIATTIGSQAVRLILARRRTAAERHLPLADLINLATLDDYKRRSLQREIDAIVDTVSARLESYIQHEWRDLPESDRIAAINSAQATFKAYNLSDESFFASDARPIILARRMRSQANAASVAADLGGSAGDLYQRLLDESCVLYCQLVVNLAPFVNRGIAELLARTSSLSYQADLILQRLPLRSLDAPEGDTFDAEFRLKYLNHISLIEDEIELYGIDINRYRPHPTLSVAYISLSATSTYQHQSSLEPRWLKGDSNSQSATKGSSIQIENALAGSNRMHVLGEAGSGKTTLLSWLGIMSARSSFRGELAVWNDRVPFLVKLRGYVDVGLPTPEQFLDATASTIRDLMPRNWVHRTLSSGKGLLLVDGLDELPASKRRSVRQWLRNLLKTYPDIVAVLTARPTAASADWMANEGFSSVALNRMGPAEVKALITQWHLAIRDAGNLPCPEDELLEYERDLLLNLDASPHLQGLATSPLLCSMLCALNLDRHKALPPNRMAIYQAALDMLLERRDAERGVIAEPPLPLSLSNKLELLQYLAWRLSLNGKTELDKAQAISRLEERLRMISAPGIEAEAALSYLVSRSGVIREPVIGRIDFVHRTFQEYLTAREAADNGDIGFLVDRAHLDAWQETVVMAAGHAIFPTRKELITGLLERADNEKRYCRRLRLLAAACLETAGALEPSVRASVESCLATLVPPRKENEARSLARAGSAVFPHAPDEISSLPATSARAMITTLAIIGGPEALDIMSKYAADKRYSVAYKFLELCRYFDPKDYAARVLSKVDFGEKLPSLMDRNTLACFRYLPDARVGLIQLHDVIDFSVDLREAPKMNKIWAQGAFEDFSVFGNFAETLGDITLWTSSVISEWDVLERLPLLKELRIGVPEFHDIAFLARLPQLSLLWLTDLDGIQDLSVLESLLRLHTLRLGARGRLPSLEFLCRMHTIEEIQLYCPIPTSLLSELARYAPTVKSLRLYDTGPSLDSIESLESLDGLERLNITSDMLSDLTPFARMSALRVIHLRCPRVTDLSPLANLGNLRTLQLSGEVERVDLNVLNNLSATIIRSDQYDVVVQD